MSDFLKTFGEDLKQNVPGFIACAVIEIKSGISFYSLSVDPSFDPEIACVYNLEVAKSKMKAIQALGLKDEIQDILITLKTQIHIIDIAANGEYMVYVAVDAVNGNLGMTRSLLNRYKKTLVERL